MFTFVIRSNAFWGLFDAEGADGERFRMIYVQRDVPELSEVLP
jgi:hypothetical protein